MAKFKMNAAELDMVAGGESRPNFDEILRDIKKYLGTDTHGDVKFRVGFESTRPVRA